MPPSSECVKVVVRCRPLSSQERADDRQNVVTIDENRQSVTVIKSRGIFSEFTFDGVFGPSVNQADVYSKTARDIVEGVLEGFNGTVFAYGQTGTGKSYTMVGKDDEETGGLIPRAFDHIFSAISATSTTNTRHLVRASYLEIYNEEIRDLLTKKSRLELRDGTDGSVIVKDLSTVFVENSEQALRVLSQGQKNRVTSSTLMNDESSRSHSVFTLTIETANKDPTTGQQHIRVGKLNLVDLAGSERQSKTGSSGEQLREATRINLSLSALGNVISSLVEGGRGGLTSPHIPYRDSKLTRLLQDSLGGNTKTVMVANIGPADWNIDETISTLRYANRAKSIKNKPRINEDPKDAVIRQYQDQIEALKAALARVQQGGPTSAVGEGGIIDEEEPVPVSLVAKLRSMEAKLLQGTAVLEQAAVQERELQRAKRELAEKKIQDARREEEAKNAEEERILLAEKFDSQSDQVAKLSAKLERLLGRYRELQSEMAAREGDHAAEREGLILAVKDAEKQSKRWEKICKEFLPEKEVGRVFDCCAWNPDREDWSIEEERKVGFMKTVVAGLKPEKFMINADLEISSGGLGGEDGVKKIISAAFAPRAKFYSLDAGDKLTQGNTGVASPVAVSPALQPSPSLPPLTRTKKN